jgi:hypothetical protein
VSTQTRIREARVSFVWFERWGDIWGSTKPIAMEFLRSADGYTKEFDQAIKDTVTGPLADQEIPAARLEPDALTPPWPVQSDYPHWFWIRYLGKAPQNVDGQLALSKLAPFHAGFPASIKPQSKWIGIIADGFVYPHGIGLVLTLILTLDRDQWPSGGVQSGVAARSALQAYNDELYNVAWNGGEPVTQRFSELADALLDHLHDQVLGPGTKAGERTRTPFVLSAVVRGDTDSIAKPPPEFGDVHRMLQAISSLRKTWENDKLTPLKDALLRVRRSAPEGDLLYHTSRGRAVWFPSSFAEKRPFIRSSGCYHSNLALLHLQTEALLQALAVRRDLLDKGVKVPDLLIQIAKDAVQQLSSLYSSDDSSYQSSSVRVYLDDTPSQKQLVNTTLGNYGLDALKYEAWPT